MKITTSLSKRLGAIGLCAALGAGCVFDNQSNSKPSIWVGLPLDSLKNVQQLLVHGDQLLIADRDPSQPGIAIVDTSGGAIAAYYSEKLPPASMALVEGRYVILTETDYTEGSISVLDLQGKSLQQSVLPFGSDNFADTAGGEAFLFDHTTGAVTGFTGHTPGQNVNFNFQAGANSNPYDIAIANGTAFIPRYNLSSLLIADPTQLNGGALDSIDLSAYDSQMPSDSAATAPRMAFATTYNGYVFVALQRLNYAYQDLDTSLVVVIDAASKKVVATIPLQFKNPISAHAVGSTWFLSCAADYSGSEGGVEKIDLSGRVDGGAVVSAQSLGGDIYDFIPVGDHAGYAAYSSDYGTTTRVKRIAY